MSAESAVTTVAELESSAGYIRGGAGLPAEGRQVLRIGIGCGAVALALLSIVLAVQGVHQNSRNRGLARRGVAVSVTVTSCIGVATGTGITASEFICRGSFSLDGRRYEDVIGGSSQPHPRGEVLRGVADPDSPTTLSTPQAVAAAPSESRPFVLAAIPAIALIVLAGAALRLTSRGGRLAAR